MEYYLSHPDRNVRLILTKFRLSEHKLLIEIDRNLKIPRDQVRFAMSWKMNFIFFFECKRNAIFATNGYDPLYSSSREYEERIVTID